MIKVVAKGIYKDGTVSKVKDLYSNLVDKSRLESGCLTYELFQDINNENVLTVIEEWESEDHLIAHQQTKHFTRIVPVIGEYRISSEINIYTKIL